MFLMTLFDRFRFVVLLYSNLHCHLYRFTNKTSVVDFPLNVPILIVNKCSQETRYINVLILSSLIRSYVYNDVMIAKIFVLDRRTSTKRLSPTRNSLYLC